MKKILSLIIVAFGIVTANAQAPVALIRLDDSVLCVKTAITYVDSSLNSPTAWTWSCPGATPSSGNTPNLQVSYANPGIYSISLTVSNSFGSSTVTLSNKITVKDNPTQANAGPDQSLCNTFSSTLAGNTPAVGTGIWYVNTGGGTLANNLSPTSGVSNLSVGVNTLQWNTFNNPCSSTMDIMTITVYDLPSPANAGPNQTVCELKTVTLAGNNPVVGTGTWTVVSGTGTFANPNSPTTTVTGLSVGANVFQWSIANGPCTPNTSQVTITVDPAPAVSVLPVSPSICIGDSVQLTATTGHTSYSWLPSAGLNSTINDTVIAKPTTTSTYTLTTTGANGCTRQNLVNVFVFPIPTITATTSKDTFCTNQPVKLTGMGGSTYTWAPATGLNTTFGVVVYANPTVVTTYTVTGNVSGCTDTATITIHPLLAPNATVTPGAALICKGNSATLTANGGNSYSWAPSAGLASTTTQSVVASPVVTTLYSVFVSAINGCKDTANVIVSVNPPPIVSVLMSPATGMMCLGDTATIYLSGAQTYTWSPATGLSSTSNDTVKAYPASTTTYTITANTQACSTSTQTVTLTVTPKPVISIAPTGATICEGKSSSLTASGGVSYQWSPATGLSTTTSYLVVASPVVTTTYTVTGNNGQGCTDTASVTILVNPKVNLSVSTNPASCGIGGDATASVTGGTGPFTYLWDDMNAQTTSTATGLLPGTYKVSVTDTKTCSAQVSSNVTIVASFAINMSYTNVLCKGQNNGTATATATGGTPPYAFSWSTGATTSSVSNLAAGTYTVTVNDMSGCYQSVAVTISEPDSIKTKFSIYNTNCKGQGGQIILDSLSGGTSPYTYAWSTGDKGPSIAGLNAGTYFVTVKDANGCTKKDTLTVKTDTLSDCLFIPNVFTPNYDGDHDQWVIENADDYNVIHVKIFNRWGNIVYNDEDYINNWDGTTIEGKELPAGVYYYIVDFDAGKLVKSGYVTILR